MELLIILVLLAVIGGVVLVSQQSKKKRLELERQTAVDAVKRTASEDVVRFGEELQRLDTDVTGRVLDEATQQDYSRALDEYESAKTALDTMKQPDDVKLVTERLEDGRYALACVKARVDGRPVPVRRAPCFLNPQHGPSTEDVEWAPPGGVKREVPVCAADAERIKAGAEPDIRKVTSGSGRRVPYWEGGPAYGGYANGYFGNFAMGGLLPGLFIGSMLSGGWDGNGSYSEGFADGQADGGGDGGGDAGGDGGGGDGGGGDFGGGGGDFGGGGFDFGGGGFGDF